MSGAGRRGLVVSLVAITVAVSAFYWVLTFNPRQVTTTVTVTAPLIDGGGLGRVLDVCFSWSRRCDEIAVRLIDSAGSKRLRNHFYDWYDLGGVVETSIYVARGAQYWMRFVLASFQCALDDRILALIPRQGVQFDEAELKVLLAYLNSSFTQLQAEVTGRSTGGGI